MIDESVAKHTEPGGRRKNNTTNNIKAWSTICVYLCVCVCVYIHVCKVCVMCEVSYGFVLLKMKNALPSGIGVIFSFFTSSEMTGRGPDGTSGSSSSAAVSSLSSSSSLQTSKKCVGVYIYSNSRDKLLYNDFVYLVIFIIVLFVPAINRVTAVS